ncbi:hypothetical protein T484DRAFT_1809330 [Baffinella frigidus]|nr:hypothetical protein T484DRAFT_1809330 [Cryptophyta sp. CCMP2293]
MPRFQQRLALLSLLSALLPHTRAFQLGPRMLLRPSPASPSPLCSHQASSSSFVAPLRLSARPQRGARASEQRRARVSELLLQMSRLPRGGGGGGNDLLGNLQRFLQNAGSILSCDNLRRFLQNAGSSGLLLPTLLLLLWSSGQFNWLFSLVNTVFLLIFIIPVIGVVALNLWVKTSLVNGNCPSCKSPVMVAKSSQSMCMQCGTPLIVEDRAGVSNTRVCMQCGTPLIVEDGVVSRAGVYNTQQVPIEGGERASERESERESEGESDGEGERGWARER